MYISDSSGWKAAEAYVALAEEELGVPVELIYWRRGGLSMIARSTSTVLRVTDIYLPIVAAWQKHRVRDACMTTFETTSSALRNAAQEYGATFLSALDAYNGPDHFRDPVAAGLIDTDDEHPGDAGGQALAEALAATGFEPTQRHRTNGDVVEGCSSPKSAALPTRGRCRTLVGAAMLACKRPAGGGMQLLERRRRSA